MIPSLFDGYARKKRRRGVWFSLSHSHSLTHSHCLSVPPTLLFRVSLSIFSTFTPSSRAIATVQHPTACFLLPLPAVGAALLFSSLLSFVFHTSFSSTLFICLYSLLLLFLCREPFSALPIYRCSIEPIDIRYTHNTKKTTTKGRGAILRGTPPPFAGDPIGPDAAWCGVE